MFFRPKITAGPKPLFSRQLAVIAYSMVVLFGVAIAGSSLWAANRIDTLATARESRFVENGIADIARRTQQEQDSLVVWDDAVLALRRNDQGWLESNIAEWTSNFYGHDRIYLLAPDNSVLRGVVAGHKVSALRFEADSGALLPLVTQLRREMEEASVGLPDSTAAITGMGVLENVLFAPGEAGVVSIRPFLPSSSAVIQAPGNEYLMVSVRLFDADFSREIAQKYALHDLHFDNEASDSDGDSPSLPVMTRTGKIIGFFDFTPYRPARQLISDTAPVVLILALLAIGMFLLVLRRLRKASTDLEFSEAQAKYLAYHDVLAGIPNRALFEDRLERALMTRSATGPCVALHAIDLDHFKNVNDTLGHGAGDSLIRQVADRLRETIRDKDTVARVGGDEFAIIQVDVHSTLDATDLAERIVRELARPFDLGGYETQIGGSVGVAVAGEGHIDPQELLRRADLALYDAKEAGRERYRLFTGGLTAAIKEKRAIEMGLREALAGAPGLELVYQPIFAARSGDVVGAEALVRWNSPVLGRLSPAQFIPLAEERGIIDQLGLWVLSEACRYAARSSLPWVAVNVSPLQFRDESFPDLVLNTLEATGLRPHRLELEVTEGLLLRSSPQVKQALLRLRAAGVRIALDDFGTGYSSISYLMSHGIDKLKIDQSFVSRLGEDQETNQIVRCIVDLGRAMHLSVTAEGVETDDQRAQLEAIGCHQLQGFLLSRPVTPERLGEILAAAAPRAASVAA